MHKRHGFTLIELLVVVAIITTLLAILMPAMGRAVQIAQSTKCQSVLRQTAMANVHYSMDNFQQYVYAGYYPNGAVYEGTAYWKYWATDEAFIKYLAMTPKDVSNKWKPGFNDAGVTWPDKFDCPNEPDRKFWEGSLTWDHNIGIAYNKRAANMTLSRVVNPARKFQFGDGENWWMDISWSDHRSWFAVGYIVNGGWGGLIPRHNFSDEVGGDGDGANIAFFDSHVERVPKEETFFYTAPTGFTADTVANNQRWDPKY